MISRASSRASVDLPEPLSPTTAVTWPSGSASETSSTACTTRARLGRSAPRASRRAVGAGRAASTVAGRGRAARRPVLRPAAPWTGKCLVRSRASSSGVPVAGGWPASRSCGHGWLLTVGAAAPASAPGAGTASSAGAGAAPVLQPAGGQPARPHRPGGSSGGRVGAAAVHGVGAARVEHASGGQLAAGRAVSRGCRSGAAAARAGGGNELSSPRL